MSKSPSIVGGSCIIASVCVGAGMLGLPSAGAGAWTVWTLLALSITMAVMTISGYMLLEAFQIFDLRVSFNTVTKKLLGNKVNFINNLAVYFVGGILIYAYITSSGLIINELTGVNSKIASVLFVVVFSLFVWHSTKAVDRISVLLIVFMVLSFFIGVFGLTTRVNTSVLFDVLNEEGNYAPYAMVLFPVALTSFGYHHSVSSMRAYYGNEQKAKQAILGGTIIALGLYALWIVSIFGNIHRHDFSPIIAQGGNVDILLSTISSVVDSKSIANAIQIFSMAAILSSFIGVGLGLFDYLADLLGMGNDRLGRTKTCFITFLPPLAMSLLFPFGFVIAIGYAGAAATIWACIIPGLLAYKVRKNYPDIAFRAPGGQAMIVIVIAFGVMTATFHLLGMFGFLPAFTGVH